MFHTRCVGGFAGCLDVASNVAATEHYAPSRPSCLFSTPAAFPSPSCMHSPCMPSPFRSWKDAGNIQTIRPHETASRSTGLQLRLRINKGTLSSGAISPGRRAWRGRGSVRGHECTKRNDMGKAGWRKRGQLGNGKAGLSCTRPRHVCRDAPALPRPRRDHSS